MFRNRVDAGRKLAAALERYRAPHTLVLAIPRGGLPVAAEVARHLGAELDVVVACKIGAPNQAELAIGAVTANGGRFLNEDVIRQLGVKASYLERESTRKRAEAREREEMFGAGRPPLRIRGRTVIVVDDGLATGATMRAAIRSVRLEHPALLIAAVPVGAPETCGAVQAEVDELVCLERPAQFAAVGQFYDEFPQVSDEEAHDALIAAPVA